MDYQAKDLEFGILGLEFFNLGIQFGIMYWDLEFGVWGLESWSLVYRVCDFGNGIWSSEVWTLNF